MCHRGGFTRQPVRTQYWRAFFEIGPVRRPVRKRQGSRQEAEGREQNSPKNHLQKSDLRVWYFCKFRTYINKARKKGPNMTPTLAILDPAASPTATLWTYLVYLGTSVAL